MEVVASNETPKAAPHPYCNACGWRKGGVDSWTGRACKCGHWEPPIRMIKQERTSP